MKPFISAGFLITMLATACSPTPEMIQTAIAQTQAAYTPTPEPTVTQTLPPMESWRVPPMPGYMALEMDTFALDNSEESMAKYADGWKIKGSYRWENYGVQIENKFAQVSFYYTRILKDRGYSIDYNNYDTDRGIGWMIYTTPTQTIYLTVLDKEIEDASSNAVIVFYQNVES